MSENMNKDLNAVDCCGMRIRKDGETGRSMVEMLGTLAIVGMLSVGAIGGYSYAMNKHRTNELIYEATKRAQWVGTQLEMNKNAQNLGFGGFGTDTFGGGKFTGTVKTDLANPNQFGIVVSALREAVCENIVKGLETETNGVIRAVLTTDGATDFDVDNCDENAEFLLVFNRDLSTSDSEITPNESEVSGEVSEQASVATEATATQNPDDEHCNGNGSWNGSSCYCDNGWQGDNCSEEEPESSETETSTEPEETTTGTGQSESTEPGDSTLDCGSHGEQAGSACVCDTGWQGVDCSESYDYTDCNGHGSWDECGGGCNCSSGYYGPDCSQEGAVSCDDNSNCDSGYFCQYDSSTISCTDGPSGQGKCVKVSGSRGGSKNGFTWSNTSMDWFSAENFCAAQNKDMPTIDSFECYKDGSSTVFTNGMTGSWGYCCKANGTTCNSNDWAAGGETRSSKFASKIVSLKSTVGGDQWFWTQSLTNDSCNAFSVYLNVGAVNFSSRAVSDYYALCE